MAVAPVYLWRRSKDEERGGGGRGERERESVRKNATRRNVRSVTRSRDGEETALQSPQGRDLSQKLVALDGSRRDRLVRATTDPTNRLAKSAAGLRSSHLAQPLGGIARQAAPSSTAPPLPATCRSARVADWSLCEERRRSPDSRTSHVREDEVQALDARARSSRAPSGSGSPVSALGRLSGAVAALAQPTGRRKNPGARGAAPRGARRGSRPGTGLCGLKRTRKGVVSAPVCGE